jgi:hypothetical protein
MAAADQLASGIIASSGAQFDGCLRNFARPRDGLEPMSRVILSFQIKAVSNRSNGETTAPACKLALTGTGQFRSNMRKINPLTGSGDCATPLKLGDGN